MKKLFCCMIAFVLLCGCTKSAVRPAVENIDFTAEFECDGEKFSCNCKAEQNGSFSVKFLGPETVKDMEILYTQENFSVKYMGLEYKSENRKTAYFWVTEKMSAAFSDAAKQTAQKNGEEYIIKSELDGDEYIMFLSESGYPVKLRLSNSEIIITNVNGFS